jgi:A/G-specific adenine glycosylase
MLQQTRVGTVIPYYERFLALFPDIVSLSNAPLDQVYKAWEGLGYYSRARNLVNGASYCALNFGGILPDSKALLLKIPGIGAYIAAAILSMAFGKCEPSIDGNLIRVISRLKTLDVTPGAPGTYEQIYTEALSLMAGKRPGDFNEAMMDLGATICTPRSPNCAVCPVAAICQAKKLEKQELYPGKKVKKQLPIAEYTVCVLVRGDKTYVRRRPLSGLLAGLFEFPMYPGRLTSREMQKVIMDEFGVSDSENLSINVLADSAHTFSHLKWKMNAFLVEILADDTANINLAVREPSVKGQFVSSEEIEMMTFSAAMNTYRSVAALRLSDALKHEGVPVTDTPTV